MNKPKIELIIGNDLPLRGRGNEKKSWCPFCSSDKKSDSDRFVVWLDSQRFWCRQCAKSGDVIEYVKLRDNVDFINACQVLGITLDGNSSTRPRKITPVREQHELKRLSEKRQIGFKDSLWQTSALKFSESAMDALLWGSEATGGNYLKSRGLTNRGLWADMGLGFTYEFRGFFGDNEIWLPMGIVIPYEINKTVLKINVRNMGTGKKFIQASGSANMLYNFRRLRDDTPAVIVESEIDALSIMQAVENPRLITPVATGSTSASRILNSISRLARCPRVYVAFDSDDAGETASEWWLDMLPNAVRLRPTAHDVNDMLTSGDDIKKWLGV